MRIWYDTEFIEDGHTIDLISIGMVAEDGRQFYAISTEFDPSKASDWVKENVLAHLPPRHVNLSDPTISPNVKAQSFNWSTRDSIRSGLLSFCNPEIYGKPEFWGYYSSYDHVALCQLFGTMMDLPKGWPMYTRDIKQWCDALGNPQLPPHKGMQHDALADARWTKEAWEFLMKTQEEQEEKRRQEMKEAIDMDGRNQTR